PADEKQANGKKVGVREGFVNVPALVGTQPGAEFEFDFEGRGCGLFITAGPDAAEIEFSIDGGAYRKAILRKNLSLHLPQAVVLDDQLQPGSHTVQVRIANSSTPVPSALRVFHLLLN
ncbi:MAG: hypothetical protein ACK53L_28165, partial [Pirellulaceae bacterium]